jgi:hypothetical protein
MRNALTDLLQRPRLAAVRQKVKVVWNVFHTGIIVSAIALPVLALSPNAHADTLKEVTAKGIVLSVSGMDVGIDPGTAIIRTK